MTKTWPASREQQHSNRALRRVLPMVLVLFFWIAWLSVPDRAQAQIRAEAVPGVPFGVGRLQVTLPEPMRPQPLGLAGLKVSEASGRVLYPVVDTGELGPVMKGVKGVLDQSRRPALKLFGGLLGGPPKTSVYFLFEGDGPLELTLQSRQADVLPVTPKPNRAAYRRLLREWWRLYTASPGWLTALLEKPDYPPQVENYLRTMLAYRLGLRLPKELAEGPSADQLRENLGLLLATESVRLAMVRDRFLQGTALGERADRPLPEPLTVPDLELPEVPEPVEIEPLAMRVPAECFYVRFGSFANYFWVRDTLAKWGGDVQNLIALRGLDLEGTRRMEEAIVLKQSALARLFGGTAIADMAIVGSDFFFRDGGSFGLLFHARNNLLLGGDVKRQRLERVKKDDGASDETITIAGREVRFLSSPDGSARSFYAADGDFHFVTRSKTLMRRFLETGSGRGALGSSQEFRYARSLMPLGRNDTVFVYLSDAFMRSLVGPHTRVETARRLEALADLELAQLAVLAAAAEGQPADTVDELVGGGFLPPGFGVRPDGSRTILEGGEVHDSLRGRRGSFVPVADVEVNAVSRFEAEAYHQFCGFYRSSWERLDPIVAGVRRQPQEGNRERIVIDARMTPLAEANYQRLRQKLGPPDPMRLAPIPGDAVAVEAVLADQRLFGGLREIRPPSRERLDRGIVRMALDTLVGYVGTTGKLGLLSLLNAAVGGPSNEAGYAAGADGVWRRQHEQFTVFSFQPEVLAEVTPQLRFEEAQRPAQIRLRVADVSQDPITPMVNNMGYARASQTSLGNVRLMHQLAQQLHVPGEYCREAAEFLLDARLVCPLGGTYVFEEMPGGPGFWTSTALADHPAGGLFTTQAPEGFVAPPLNWFRGLDLDVTVTPEAASLHADLLMQMPGEKPAAKTGAR